MKYKPYRMENIFGGARYLYRFDNGFGASVVCHLYSYGGPEGKYELAVIKFKSKKDDEWEITYSTPVTNDVIGWLEETEVDRLLTKIKKLRARKSKKNR